MNEYEAMSMLQEAETTLRNFEGQNLFTQQVRNFGELALDLPDSDLSESVFTRLRNRCLLLLEESGDTFSADTWSKLHFILGRLNFLLGDQSKARGHFLNAGRHGMHMAMIFYNVAMSYAVDLEMDSE